MLISYPEAIACVRGHFNLLEQLPVTFKNPQSLGEIGKPKIDRLDSGLHRTERGLILLLHDVSIALRHFPSQPQFSWIRKILRDAEPEVREIAIRIPGKRPRTSHIDLLRCELRIWKRRDLGRNLLRGFPTVPRRLNLRIVLLRFLQ